MQRLKSITTSRSFDYTSLFFILFFIFLGAAVRFFPILNSNFPLTDGGLFYRMTMDLLDNHFSLPAFITYNGSVIPYGYPPLAFYLMAFFQHFLHIGVITQLRFFPPLISTLTIPALYFLSKSITGSKVKSIYAIFAYALMPASYLWLIMGGGITRSLGLFFSILAVLFIWEMFHTLKISSALLSIVFCSLTILSHPGTAWFLFLSAMLIGILYGLNRKGLLLALITLLGVLLITLPWWLQVLRNAGFVPFINAFRTGGFINLSVFLFYFTGEIFASFIAVVAFTGIFAELSRRKVFLFSWLILIALLAPRMGPTFATLPAAILFGSGMVWVIFPGLLSNTGHGAVEVHSLSDMFTVQVFKIFFSVILILVLISAMAAPFNGNTPIQVLSQYDQQAMEWVSKNTPVDSKFAVVTGGEWPTDSVSEWFPSLANRTSISTVQGSEWSPGNEFNNKINRNVVLQGCATQGFACILDWSNENSESYSYLYLSNSKSGNPSTRIPLAYSPTPTDKFQLVYENPGILIYKVAANP
jgi:hypothetical protein